MVLSLVVVGDERRLEGWSRWSSGLSCGASISSAASRSRSSRGRRGCRATRCGGRCGASGRRATRGRRGRACWSRFKDEIHRLLREDPKLPGVRVRELLEPLGCRAGKTVVDDYLREVRPLFARAAQDVSADGLSAGRGLPVRCLAARAQRSRSGTARRAAAGSWSRALGYSRAGAGVLVFSKQTEDLLAGIAGCLQRLGALPRTLVWDRQAGIHGHGGRPTEAFAAFCGQLRVGWRFCEPADPQAKGAVERVAGLRGDQLRAGPARSPTSSTSRTSSTAGSRRSTRAQHKTLRERPIDRLRVEREHDGGAAARAARHRAALGHPGRARPLPAR